MYDNFDLECFPSLKKNSFTVPNPVRFIFWGEEYWFWKQQSFKSRVILEKAVVTDG